MRHSHSSLVNAQSCQRLYKLENLDRLEARKRPTYFTLGSAFHSAVGLWHEGMTVDRCLEGVNEEFNKIDYSLLGPKEVANLEVEHARVLGMAAAYMEHYKSDLNQYSHFIVESHEEIDIIPGETYHGFIDVLMKDAAGDWWIKETKTAAKNTVTPAYLERIKMDNQVLGYAFLARKRIGQFPKGVVYDIACKTSHRKRQQETVAQFCNRIRNLYATRAESEHLFHREEIIFDRRRLQDWWDERRALISLLKKQRERDKYPWPKNTGHCLKFGSPCSMFSVCESGRIDPMLYKHRDEEKKGVQQQAAQAGSHASSLK